MTAFLVEAFDQLYTAYESANDRLADLRGHPTLFDLDRQILQNNVYGVDLNEEAVEICRLSLWIKTAQRGKELTALDHTIRVGNSVVNDVALHPRAFNWSTAFPKVTAAGGFDVIVGNPPYVRQELLTPIKPHLQEHFKSYHGLSVHVVGVGLLLASNTESASPRCRSGWGVRAFSRQGRMMRRHSWPEESPSFVVRHLAGTVLPK